MLKYHYINHDINKDMVREGGMGQPMEQNPIWKEFCRLVDEGEFDEEIEAYHQAIVQETNDKMKRIERPTTPQDLIDAAELQDLMDRGSREPIPGISEKQIRDIARKATENLLKDIKSLPRDVVIEKQKMLRRERFKRDPANFEKFCKDFLKFLRDSMDDEKE